MRIALALLVLCLPLAAQSFVNFETPHVHPLELTPDGLTLLAVNTGAGTLELFDASGPGLVPLGSVPVGVDPCSVRARGNREAWVTNTISDSVSIVDLPSRRVRATLKTADEPSDVVFAGSPQRAFVSCSEADTVQVWNPANLAAGPTSIVLDAEDPRAMAVSPGGDKVYVAIFSSGNGSTVLGGGEDGGVGNLSFPPNVVSDPAGPYGGINPPPNAGGSFDPPKNGANPAPPKVSLIVKKNAAGQWMDDNGGDWTSLVSGADAAKSGRPVGWDLPDHDIAVIDAGTLAVSWVNRLMNIDMAIAVNPATGAISTVGTEAINETRFEPVVNGSFVRVEMATVPVAGSPVIKDLNPHLDYSTPTLPQSERDKSLGDPRGVAFTESGANAWITGMGSNDVIVVDADGDRLGPPVAVGEGPTGVVARAATNRVYVLNKFAGTISIVDATARVELAQVPLHDPTPVVIKVGRKHLYDTHKNSGLGQLACASCHVNGRMDRLAWDLGDPAGAMKAEAEQNDFAGIPGLSGGFPDWHSMKGPMLTQTLQDIIGKEPHHWRGDRDGIEEFSGAFIGLQGDDTTLTTAEMQQFEDFLATITFPPNPFRNLDNTLPVNLPLPGHFTTGRFAPAGQPLPNGNAVQGLARYRPPNLIDGGAFACATCHTLPTGMGTNYRLVGTSLQPIAPGPNGERHHMLVDVDGTTNVSMKVPQLRNAYVREGFNTTQLSNRSGFGFLHDGSVDSLERFIAEPIFNVTSDQDIANLVAFVLSIGGSELPAGSATNVLEPPGTASLDSHAAVGRQNTLATPAGEPGQIALIAQLLSFADAGKVGVIAKGVQGGVLRGWRYDGANAWQSDKSGQSTTTAALESGAGAGAELTFTVVPKGSQTRLGIDRDLDGYLDRDELDAGSDPADTLTIPGTWQNLGLALAGTHGEPIATGSGTLAAGSLLALTLQDARANSAASLIVGSSAVNLPFKGGTLVPSFDLLVAGLNTGGAGQVLLAAPMPAGLPSGFGLWFQWWISDPAGPKGFASSNALKATAP
jgi:DNA-binding beta-propeller fold protein YncE